MNTVEIIAEHTAFDVYWFQKFEFCYSNVKIELNCPNGKLEIQLSGRKSIDKIFIIFYLLFDLLFLILGGYPIIQDVLTNGEKIDISEWSRKYDTSSHFMKRGLRVADVSINNINANTLGLLETVHHRSLYSMQYLVCKEYEHIVADHKFVLVSHTIDGFVRHSFYENQLKQKVRFVNPKAKVEYRHRVEAVFEPFFRYHRKFNCEILKAMRVSKKKLVDVVSDTRNDFSHFLDKKAERLNSGCDMLHYFYVINFALRLFLLSNMIKVYLDDRCVKEYMFALHDWISLNRNENFNNFKSVAYLQYEGRKEFANFLKMAKDNK